MPKEFVRSRMMLNSVSLPWRNAHERTKFNRCNARYDVEIEIVIKPSQLISRSVSSFGSATCFCRECERLHSQNGQYFTD
jgi:hypothetical protein